MQKEVNEDACFLDMPNGLSKEIKYSQNFVRAPNQGKYPCNYEAQTVKINDPAMNISMGKK